MGCGTARNLIAIARLYPGTRFSVLTPRTPCWQRRRAPCPGRDPKSESPSSKGARTLSPEVFRPSPAARLCDFFLQPFDDPRLAARAHGGHRISLAAGRLHVVDFGDLPGLGRLGAGALRFWLRYFHVEPRAEILRALEGTAGDPQKPSGNLWISPGRYAYLERGARPAF